MGVPCEKTFLLVPSSRSSAEIRSNIKVTVFKKMADAEGISVSQTQLVVIRNIAVIIEDVYFKF